MKSLTPPPFPVKNSMYVPDNKSGCLIFPMSGRLKQADSRSEYAEMNISKLHLRIDELEDEIIREKLKINAVSGQLDETFNDMLNKY